MAGIFRPMGRRMCRLLAERGHDVCVVTNADQVELEYRCWFLDGDAFDGNGRGSIQCVATEPWSVTRLHYIPATNPYTSRLASLATEVVREHGCDVIVAWYLEPYGVAANLASSWTGVPFVVRHSGSDRDVLMADPELATGYKEALRNAAGVISSGTDVSRFGVSA